MNGEKALGIITITAFVFILVFMLATGGIDGSAETITAPAAETPVVTPPPEVKTTPAPEMLPQPTAVTVATPEPKSSDPLEGLWISRGSFTERLLLTAGGAGEMTTITDEAASARGVAWEYDPTIRIGHLRAYRLTVPGEGESILYLDDEAGTLNRNGQDLVLTYTPAP
jgi:hypothetical protein